VGGILGHNLLSLAFFRWESLRGWDFFRASFFTMEFRLSRSLCHELFFFFHDGILAITKPLSRTFFFFFHDGILAITKPLSRTFFFFHDGILAITKPFSRTFFLFHNGIPAITKPFSRTFSFFTMGFWKYVIWGNTLFIHISQRVFT
jgi:hypothetical protein